MGPRNALLVVLAAVVAAVAGGSALGSGSSASAVSLRDNEGDAGAAPDITQVRVGNDVVAGPLVFWVTVANRTALTTGEAIMIFLDTDRNPFSGGATGAEYAIVYEDDLVALYQWTGSGFVGVNAPGLQGDFARATRTLRVSLRLTGIRAFDFFAVAFHGNEEFDSAPDGPEPWAYSFTSGRPPLRVTSFALAPKAPRAGRALAAAAVVARGDTFDALGSGKVGCTLRVRGATLRALRPGFRSGRAVCSWRLPATAKGAIARGTVSVTFGGTTVRRSFSLRVR